MRASLALVVCCFAGSFEASAQSIKVAESAWNSLSADERASIQRQYTVEIATVDAFGIIIDNQGVNQSTPGTSGGAVLGAMTADAIYIDKAFKGSNWNYSAKENLGYALLGAMIGSAFDKPPVSQFQFRYAVRLGNGDIRYYDHIKSDAFRHPVGICVSLPAVSITDQSICSQDANTLRVKYLNAVGITPAIPTLTAAPSSGPGTQIPAADNSFVQCRLGTLAPVRTTAEKCSLIGGTRIQ